MSALQRGRKRLTESSRKVKVSIYLPPQGLSALRALADAQYGGNVSAAIEALLAEKSELINKIKNAQKIDYKYAGTWRANNDNTWPREPSYGNNAKALLREMVARAKANTFLQTGNSWSAKVYTNDNGELGELVLEESGRF